MELKEYLEQQRMSIDTHDVELFKKTVSSIYEKYPSEEDKKIISQFIADVMKKSSDKLTVEIENLCLKARLKDYDEIIPYSYIAKHYFKKSKAWLSQRLNGYDGNGKPIEFNKNELDIFSFALDDISKKLGSITLK
jgi:hypothetical protein